MTAPIETILIAVGLLLLISTISSKVSGRYGVPALLLFLGIGMLAGSEGIGGIPFDDYSIAQMFGVVALAVILFSGGLDTDWRAARPALGKGLLLATIGVAVTAGVVGVVAAQILGISLVEGLLLGAIVSSTDAAAVLSILRTQSVSLKGEIRPLLELESGSNDPMAVFLTAALTGLVMNPSTNIAGLIGSFLLEMALGAVAGYAIGKAGVWMVNNLRLEIEGLYPVLTLSLALLTYGLTARIHGNGFLAVYIAGIIIGNGDILYRRSLMRFHEGVAWLMQITMFLMLGLLVFPSSLPSVAGVGLLITAVLIFVARPLSVFISLAFTRMNIREKALVSWVGLRGAVPIVLATFPLIAGVPRASLMFDIVFFSVFVSVLLQGSTLSVVARWLKVGQPIEPRPRSPIEFERTENTRADLIEVVVPEGSAAAGRTIGDLHFPEGALVALVNRDDCYGIAHGDTPVYEGDLLMVLADRSALAAVRAIVAPRVAGDTPEDAAWRG